MNKKLIAYHGDSPVQVEGFPEDCARSCEGALHILPGRHKTVTDGEYQHILNKYGWMKPKLRVVAELNEESSEKKSEENSSGAGEEKESRPEPSGQSSESDEYEPMEGEPFDEEG